MVFGNGAGDQPPATIFQFARREPAQPSPATIIGLKSEVNFNPSQFWAILDILPVAVLVGRGRDCTDVEGNSAARMLLRAPPGQNLSRSAPESEQPDFEIYANGKPVPPSDLPMQRAAATGKPVPRSECEVRFADGNVVFLAGHSVPLVDEAGAIWGSIGVFIDITHSKQLELQNQQLTRELQRVNAELEQRFSEEVAERKAIQARLGHLQRMNVLGQLASGIAHDLNNVLQAVQTAAELIVREPHNPNRVIRFSSVATAAVTQGMAVTGRLLGFARRDASPIEVVDPARLLASLQEILVHTLGTGTRLHVDAQVGLPALRLNRRDLETVLINLAINGRDAMDGDGLLTLSATLSQTLAGQTATDPSPSASGPYVCLSVGDTGSGMTPDTLARVTEPFFTTKPQGTGLGLAMAHEFARDAGGALKIDSTPGRGTTVELWLPTLA